MRSIIGILALAKRKVQTGSHLLIHDRTRLLHRLRWQMVRFVVFAAAPSDVPPPTPLDGAVFRRLSDEETETLPAMGADQWDALERCARMKGKEAYAVFWHGKFAHVCWLISGDQDAFRQPPRLLKLHPGEAELTFCVTLPEFRGLGIYPFAIRNVASILRERPVTQLYMITLLDNIASQRGISNAGFAFRRGGILCLRFLGVHFVYRGFRLWRYLATVAARVTSRS